MDLNGLTIGEIAGFIVSVTAVGGVFSWIFSKVHKIDKIEEHQKEQDKRMDGFEETKKSEKDEILAIVDNTNVAVNLLCSALSAMIDNELNDNNNKEQLLQIKKKLDEKKEIV